jgi:hypothetical protein
MDPDLDHWTTDYLYGIGNLSNNFVFLGGNDLFLSIKKVAK